MCHAFPCQARAGKASQSMAPMLQPGLILAVALDTCHLKPSHLSRSLPRPLLSAELCKLLSSRMAHLTRLAYASALGPPCSCLRHGRRQRCARWSPVLRTSSWVGAARCIYHLTCLMMRACQIYSQDGLGSELQGDLQDRS